MSRTGRQRGMKATTEKSVFSGLVEHRPFAYRDLDLDFVTTVQQMAETDLITELLYSFMYR